MIANGTGIAPFRSIVQYFELLPVDQRVPIRLYVLRHLVILEFRMRRLIFISEMSGENWRRGDSYNCG
jgi:hypothetical protein